MLTAPSHLRGPTPRPETAPRDGTMIGGHVPRDDLAGVMAAIRAAHRAHVEARA